MSAAKIAAFRAAVEQYEAMARERPTAPLKEWMTRSTAAQERASMLIDALDAEDALPDALAYMRAANLLRDMTDAHTAAVEQAWLDGLR